MKRIDLITYLLLLTTTTLLAQPDGNVRISWIAPLATNQQIEGEEINVEVLIESPLRVEKEAVFILLNDRQVGHKADVVKFGRLNNELSKFNFASAVELKEGENRIKIGVKMPDNTKHFSMLKILNKNGNQVTEVVRNHVDGKKGIFWMSPRWQSTPIVRDQRQFQMTAIINSRVEIKKKDIYLVRQGIVKVQPAPNSKLKEIAPGKYEFKNTMQLVGEGITDIVIKVRSPLAGEFQSDPLPINFSPYRPNVHLFSVGTQTNLNYTINDAHDFAELFRGQGQEQGGRLFNVANVDVLTGQEATASAIKSNIERLETKFKNGLIGEKDLIILYLSSHGFLDDKRRLRIQGDDYDPGAWRTTSVSYERDIIEILETIPCKKIIFIDACYSGGSGAKGDDLEVQHKIEELNKTLSGITTIVSSSGSEASYEDDVWKNGAFTEAIVEGLRERKADTDRNSLITINELWYYIKERVPYLVKVVKEKAQHPQLLDNELGDAAIFYTKY